MYQYNKSLKEVVDKLCEPDSYKSVVHIDKHSVPMPSTTALEEIMELLRAIIFPGYFMESDIDSANIEYYTGAKIDTVLLLLAEQIKRGQCFACQNPDERQRNSCSSAAKDVAYYFIESLPEIRQMLALDVEAAYEGDPAAKSYGETIFCYPSIKMMTNFRVAHRLYQLGVPVIPRFITEMGHSQTGIDIHPSATIGKRFFMDHGTGIVIGGTAIIGSNVKLYQSVTLGAKSFPLDENGNPVKGIDRHPIVEDNVVIYSGATVLGRITIGEGSVIGGNSWIMKDVPKGSKILKDTKM